jgi:hypothetical protein
MKTLILIFQIINNALLPADQPAAAEACAQAGNSRPALSQALAPKSIQAAPGGGPECERKK